MDERSEQTSPPAPGRGLGVGGHAKGLTCLMRNDVSRIRKIGRAFGKRCYACVRRFLRLRMTRQYQSVLIRV